MAEEATITETTEAPAVPDDSPEAGIEALRTQMAAAEEGRRQAERERDDERQMVVSERAAREEAERRASEATAEAQTRARSAFEAQYDSVINAHAAAQGELTSAKGQLKNALAEGDFEKVAELSEQIGLQAARVRQFEEGKTILEAQRKDGHYPGYASGGDTSREDPKEAFIRSKTPRTSTWLRRNDRYFTDRNFQMAVTGAHNLALARGMAPDSDEYFRYIEEQSGLRQPEAPATAATAPAAPHRQPTPAAPAAGSTASAVRPQSNNSVTLTHEEREVCRINGISEANYAKQKIALMAEGKYGIGH